MTEEAAVKTVARRAFDAIAAAQQVQCVDDLNDTLGAALIDLGFTSFGGVSVFDANRKPNAQVLFGHRHQRWDMHYHARQLEKYDPVIKEMQTSVDPLFWSDMMARRALDRDEQRVMDEAKEFGLCNGLVVPLHNLDGSVSAVVMMGTYVDADDPDTRVAGHLLAVYYGSIGRRLRMSRNDIVDRKKHHISLSARQLECLKWVRDGKSSADIGSILSLSPRTVDEHLAAACCRLGVRTRVQAVAEAALHGILQL